MIASPLDIEIKTINLKSKKLTKSVFNQIEQRSCFDGKLDFIGDRFFGYIRDKDTKYLIWSDKEKLRKTNLSDYSALRKIDPEYNSTAKDIEWVLKKCDVDYFAYDNDRGQFTIEFNNNEAVIKYNGLIDHAHEFISEVLNYQLFI